MQLGKEQLVTLLNVFEGNPPILIDHPAFEQPLPACGVSMKDGRIKIYCADLEDKPQTENSAPKESEDIIVFADGACSGNPGPGGWANIIQIEKDGKLRELENSGSCEEETTNQRMEIAAAAHALMYLKDMGINDRPITLHSDSKYLVETMNGNFRRKKNLDMWKFMDRAAEGLKIAWVHVKEDTDPRQSRCDELAKRAVPKR